MKIIECEQNSEEWHAARCGRVTASRIADVMAKGRSPSAPSATRQNYLAEIVCEQLTGKPHDSGFQSEAMRRGGEVESEAADIYGLMNDVALKKVGCVVHPNIDLALASPDRLAGNAGLIEIKCPNAATHIKTILTGKIDGRYIKQMQWQMACTSRMWCDFVSYDPRLPEEMQLFQKRVARDHAMIVEIETAVRDFLSEVDSTISALRKSCGSVEVAA